MKIKYTLSVIIFIILSINFVFAIEKSSIILTKNPKIINTDSNIKQAESIEIEITKFRKNLLIIQKKYRLEKDKNINIYLHKLSDLIYILRKIETTKIEKNMADFVIKAVINNIKNINFKVKNYLKNIQKQNQIKKYQYTKISYWLYTKLNKITILFIDYYKNKKNINSKDKKILNIIKDIYYKNLKLKDFSKKTFYNTYDMKNYLINILKSIKKDFSKIRAITKR